jgi:hypothetical protein
MIDFAGEVAVALGPVLDELQELRRELAEMRLALPPTLVPMRDAAQRYHLDGRTLVSRFPDAVVRAGRKIMFDVSKMRPIDRATVAAAAREARR